ncbi:MAG: glycine--tRNA ligase subunit beta [Anaerolineae bacterium]|nr:glycine--tRNA ligase subunit beta [Anaerolineae bacterium]
MTKNLSFQETILKLLDYWQAQGCLVQQPYNIQVGAGTMNPATSLRVLGPEPWNVVYVEPSIRPDDGRFGDNPNRMQMHHQLQVILKPDPGDPQAMYLRSLEAIGIDPRQHDIRFVEDNWESPALGAWGLGWEVWLDGQEITQFTYFQQAGSLNLDPVCVEITYGLDRIILALQDKNSVWDIDYGAQIPYGNILLESEIEHCKYYFNVADVEALTQTYDTYEREAQRCLDARLVAPAHDYNLKCSHLFNILDTRGAIGVTQRADYFKRMRRIARQVSELYIEQRQRLEFPLLDHESWQGGLNSAESHTTLIPGTAPGEPATFVLELGSEELPADDLTSALNQLRTLVPDMLDKARLRYDDVLVDGTPRRQTVIVYGLAPRQDDLETIAKGPPADRAFDSEGMPTRAAMGFARGKGVSVADLQIVEEGDKRYVSAVVRETGQSTLDVLADLLPDLIAAISFTKSMRWNSPISYSRPLRWLVALFGEAVVPFSYAGLHAGRATRGLRPYGSPLLEIADADSYLTLLSDNSIVLSTAERQERIMTQSAELALLLDGTLPYDPGLLNEVTNLVEYPTAFIGRFEQRFLDLPVEILVAVMRKHQRYFPVYKNERELLPNFIAVRNGDDQYLHTVIHGNEQVIRARFADGEFFYNKDKDKPLSSFLPDLDTLMFQAELGSMLDKVHRLEQITPALAAMIGLYADETVSAARAAALSKADLATSMVVEMTALQGIMGGHYAGLHGEPEAVCRAIAEQYETVSATRPGLVLALADRIDSLVGLTAAGLLPKGSNDPFGLRRAAIQIIENLAANAVSLDLRQAIALSAETQPIPAGPDIQMQVLDFIATRLEVLLRENGNRASVVKAVLAEQAHDPANAFRTCAALSEAITAPDWTTLLDAYARCVRITRSLSQRFTLHPGAFALAQEQTLFAAYTVAANAADGTLPTFVTNLRKLEPAITSFFDHVLVMDDDDAVRENRLALLQHIAALSEGIADLSQLEGF